MLGDEKVKKWITSLFISFLSSILLTNPVKAAIVSFVLVTILRSSNDRKELDNDKDDNNKLNNYVHTKKASLNFIYLFFYFNVKALNFRIKLSK
jgi:hypothetical protein